MCIYSYIYIIKYMYIRYIKHKIYIKYICIERERKKRTEKVLLKAQGFPVVF